jgi:hypothetical protein
MGSGSLTNADVTVPVAINRLKTGEIVTNEMTFVKNAVEGYDFDPEVAYDSAKAVVLRLMETKEYELERYSNTWKPENFGGHDFVFALESNATLTAFTTVFNKFITPVGLSGQGWLHYAKDLYYLYDPLDERGLYGIAHQFRSGNKMNNGFWKLQYFPPEDSIYYEDPSIKDKVLTDTNSNICYLMKWYLGDASNPYVELSDDAAIITSATQNFPLLRYAEAYLILAEAENELNGPTDIAYDALDELRSWRYLPVDSLDEYYLMDRTAMTKQELRSYILNERTREFIGEGYRRFDLIRWGIYLEVMNAVDHRVPYRNSQDQIISKKREQKHLLYPVPTIEIDGNTLFGPNNQGW